MKCFSTVVLLALSSVSAVFARTKIGTYRSSYTYDLYDDGKATIVGTYYSSINDATIPNYVSVSKKQYLVSEIGANAFDGKEIKKVTLNEKITGLLIKKDAFKNVKNLREFNIYSNFVDAELGAFNGIGNLVQFQGVGLRYTLDKYSAKLLKKWDLPVGKNYKYVDDNTKKHDLFTLGKKMQKEFGLYDKVAYPDNAANVCFIGAGSTKGLSVLYRYIAIVMGISYTEVLTGCDNIHYCWNYLNVTGFRETTKKWHVFDLQDPIPDYLVYSPHSFKKESDFLNTLTNYYGSSTYYDPHKFIIVNNYINFPYESRNKYPETEKFDDWLKNNSNTPRTL